MTVVARSGTARTASADSTRARGGTSYGSATSTTSEPSRNAEGREICEEQSRAAISALVDSPNIGSVPSGTAATAAPASAGSVPGAGAAAVAAYESECSQSESSRTGVAFAAATASAAWKSRLIIDTRSHLGTPSHYQKRPQRGVPPRSPYFPNPVGVASSCSTITHHDRNRASREPQP